MLRPLPRPGLCVHVLSGRGMFLAGDILGRFTPQERA